MSRQLAFIRAQLDTGVYTRAEAPARAMVEQGGWRSGNPSRDDLRAVDLLVESLWRQGKVPASTRELGEQAVRAHVRLDGPDAAPTGWALNNLANILRQQGRLAEAESLFVRAVGIVQRAYGNDSFEAGSVMGDYGELLANSGRLAEARRTSEVVLRSRIRRYGPEDSNVAWAWSNLAYLDQRAGNYPAAIRGFEAVLAMRERVQRPDHPDIAHTLNCLANLYEGVGDYDRARAFAERALAIRERAYGTHSPEVAKSLGTLASLLRETGDYTQARAVSERALAMREKAFGPDHAEVATALLNLAEVRLRMGDFSAVPALLQRALAIRTRTYGARSVEAAIVRDRLSDLALAGGDRQAARTHAAAALAARRAALGGDHPAVAQSLMRLAAADLAAGATSAAREGYAAALEIWRAAVGRGAPESGRCARLLGEVAERQGDLVTARALDEEALAIADSALGPGHPELAACWMAVARVRAASGDKAGALDAALRGEAIGREHLRATIRALPEREALRYATVRTGGLDLIAHLAGWSGRREDARRALDAVVRSRALVLDEMAWRQHAITASADPGVRREEQALRHDRDQLTHLRLTRLDSALPHGYARLLDSLRTACERRERALAERSARVRRERERERTGVAEVASALPAGTALLAYLRCTVPGRPSEYAGFVLRAGEPDRVTAVRLAPASQVDSLVAALRRNLERASGHDERRLEPAFRDAGARLRRLVWDPMVKAAGQRRMLLVVPDGRLHLVSFATLPLDRGGYVVEQPAAIQVLAAERDVAEDARRTYRGAGMLAFGAPDFDSIAVAQPPRRLPAGPTADRRRRGLPGRFTALPGTEQELFEVAALWNRFLPPGSPPDAGALIMIGKSANTDALLRHAKGRRVLHFATHGYAVDAPPVAGDPSAPTAAFAATVNPLELSGLALAGANRWRERGGRGLLTSAAIATLDLGATEWVVLSSCGSGIGPLMSGEGVLGMQRAFQAAGAGTVITSLWEVDDLAARRWMRALYTARLRRRLPTAEATRAASLELLGELRAHGASTHPHGWGAFVAVGDWR